MRNLMISLRKVGQQTCSRRKGENINKTPQYMGIKYVLKGALVPGKKTKNVSNIIIITFILCRSRETPASSINLGSW